MNGLSDCQQNTHWLTATPSGRETEVQAVGNDKVNMKKWRHTLLLCLLWHVVYVQLFPLLMFGLLHNIIIFKCTDPLCLHTTNTNIIILKKYMYLLFWYIFFYLFVHIIKIFLDFTIIDGTVHIYNTYRQLSMQHISKSLKKIKEKDLFLQLL